MTTNTQDIFNKTVLAIWLTAATVALSCMAVGGLDENSDQELLENIEFGCFMIMFASILAGVMGIIKEASSETNTPVATNPNALLARPQSKTSVRDPELGNSAAEPEEPYITVKLDPSQQNKDQVTVRLSSRM